MQFTRRLIDPIVRGEVTVSVRIWKRPHVKVGNAYRCGPGFVVVDSIQEITREDITPGLAKLSGFSSVGDLLKVAKHGTGEYVYLIEFHYSATGTRPAP